MDAFRRDLKLQDVPFLSVSLREFGIRYYNVFKQLENPNKIFEEKPLADAAIRSEIELL